MRGLTSNEAFTLYDTPAAKIAHHPQRGADPAAGRGQRREGNLTQAIADMNFIREQSGGLAPRADLTMANIIDEILKQRFYSLLFEGGHRWLDMRRHGRLDQLPNDRPTATADLPAHRIHDKFPIPQNEVDARAHRCSSRRGSGCCAGGLSALSRAGAMPLDGGQGVVQRDRLEQDRRRQAPAGRLPARRRQHDHRDAAQVGVGELHAAEGLAVHDRHHQVEQDQQGRLRELRR